MLPQVREMPAIAEAVIGGTTASRSPESGKLTPKDFSTPTRKVASSPGTEGNKEAAMVRRGSGLKSSSGRHKSPYVSPTASGRSRLPISASSKRSRSLTPREDIESNSARSGAKGFPSKTGSFGALHDERLSDEITPQAHTGDEIKKHDVEGSPTFQGSGFPAPPRSSSVGGMQPASPKLHGSSSGRLPVHPVSPHHGSSPSSRDNTRPNSSPSAGRLPLMQVGPNLSTTPSSSTRKSPSEPRMSKIKVTPEAIHGPVTFPADPAPLEVGDSTSDAPADGVSLPASVGIPNYHSSVSPAHDKAEQHVDKTGKEASHLHSMRSSAPVVMPMSSPANKAMMTKYRSRGFTEIISKEGPAKPFVPPSPVVVKGEQTISARVLAAQEKAAASTTRLSQGPNSPASSNWPGPEKVTSIALSDKENKDNNAQDNIALKKHTRAASLTVESTQLALPPGAVLRPRALTTEHLETQKAALRYSMSFQAIQEIRSKALSWGQLLDMKLLAAGMFGEVHIATYRNYQVVVKTLKPIVIPPNAPPKQERRLRQEQKLALTDFKKEMSMLTKLWHPNIVSLVGVGITPKLFMVMEFMRGGSLKEILTRCRETSSPLEPEMLLNFALDCSRGMLYLHEAFPRILHRDLKPANLLISGIEPGEGGKDGAPRPRLKIADFGLSRVLGPDKHHATERYKLTGGTGSLRYMAPEVAANQPYNEKADVYGFGVILWEMVANDLPYKTLHTHNFYKEVVRRRMRPPLYDLKQNTELIALIQDCWDHEPDRRPTFREVVRRLEHIRDHTDYLGVKRKHCCTIM